METTEHMVWFGGQCKALDDKGKVGGYLVLFGGPKETDASPLRDFFTPDTDVGLDVSTKSRMLYNHGLVQPLGTRSLGIGNLKADASGIWLEGQLALRDEYEQKIFQMVKDGKLGLSSGTANHLIRRQRQPNGSNKILSWPLGLDASLTPTPAEPRTQAVAIKSLLPPELKGLYLGDRAEPAAMMAAHSSLWNRLADAVWTHMGDEKRDPNERMEAIGSAHDEFKSLAMKMCKALLINDTTEGTSTKSVAGVADDVLLDQIGATLARMHGLEL